ncbi:MAG: transposase [Clostridium perfringens]|nr:transposase [Clostridium perfringens]
MALINFKGSIGDSPKPSSDDEKESNINESKQEYSLSKDKKGNEYNNLKLKEIEYKIKEKKNELRELEANIIKKKDSLKDIETALLKKQDVLKELEENILEKESFLTNLEEKILENAKNLNNLKKDEHIDIKPMPIKEWESRKLESIYSMVFIDTVNLKLKKQGRKISKYVYSVIGINLKGKREVLGVWVHNKESSKYWLDIFQDIKSRGVEDILIISTPLAKEYNKEISKIFTGSKMEMSILSEMRISNKYIHYRDSKIFNNDLKKIYLASTRGIALEEFKEIDNKWGEKYPIAMEFWEDKLDDLDLVFKYHEDIRKILYGTNILKAYNNKLNKVIKSNFNTFSNDEIIDTIYVEVNELSSRWSQPIRNWSEILSELATIFPDKIGNK